MKRREFISLLGGAAARRPRGRSGRARSSRLHHRAVSAFCSSVCRPKARKRNSSGWGYAMPDIPKDATW